MFAKMPSFSRDVRWLTLDAGATLRLHDAQGLWIEVAAVPGRGHDGAHHHLWLTEEGAPEDIFLQPGERHQVTRIGRTVLTAWAPLRVRIGTAAALAAPTCGPQTGPGRDAANGLLGGCCAA